MNKAEKRRRPIWERFWEKVDKTEDCWVWTACKNRDGYGGFRLDGKTVGAHILSFKYAYGPYDERLELDHTCRNRACIRPDHLELVTHRENVMRGGVAERQSHCKRDHLLAESARERRDGSGRYCVECRRISNREWRRRRQNG